MEKVFPGSREQDEGGCVCSLPASRAVGSTALSSSTLAPSCCSTFQTFPRAADRTGTAWVPEISCGPGQSPLVCPGATGAQLGWRWNGRAGSAPPAALRVVGMMGLGHLVFTWACPAAPVCTFHLMGLCGNFRWLMLCPGNTGIVPGILCVLVPIQAFGAVLGHGAGLGKGQTIDSKSLERSSCGSVHTWGHLLGSFSFWCIYSSFPPPPLSSLLPPQISEAQNNVLAFCLPIV